MGNWRMRAGECGIRVGAEKKEEEGFVGDDEGGSFLSFSPNTIGIDRSAIASDDTLLNGKTDEGMSYSAEVRRIHTPNSTPSAPFAFGISFYP